MYGTEYKLRSSSLCSLLHPPHPPPSLLPSLVQIISSAPCSQIPSVYVNVNHQVSYPYRTTDKIIILYILSFGQSSWLQIKRSGFDSQGYHIFWEVVCLERGPLSLVSTIEELLERKSSGSGLENREDSRGDPSRWPRGTLYLQKLALTPPTNGGHSIGMVHSRTHTMDFFLYIFWQQMRRLKVLDSMIPNVFLPH
jgi:hypothetical protein